MVEFMKKDVKRTLQEWKTEYADAGKDINIVAQISNLFLRIIISCTFGEDISDKEFMYLENGVEIKTNFGYALRNNLQSLLNRQVHPQILFFPETWPLYLVKKHRDDFENARRIRALVTSIILKRKEEMRVNPSLDKGDLISILLQDDTFTKTPENILNESVAFFFAGSQTNAITLSNLVIYAIQNPEIKNKVRSEFQSKIGSAKDVTSLLDKMLVENI